MKYLDLPTLKQDSFAKARELMEDMPVYLTADVASVWMNAGLIIAQSILERLELREFEGEVYAMKLFEKEINRMEKSVK